MSHDRPPRDSSTVLLLQDTPEGPHVFMVRRNLNSDFVGGAYVFPGGALDASDAAPEMLARVDGLDARMAGDRLDLPPERALAHWVTAIRETFEEAGVLLATRDGQPVVMRDEAAQVHWAARRAALLAKAIDWPTLVQAENLRFPAETLGYFSHWITPKGAPKRFSTRFFIAAVPPLQDPLADDQEVEAGRWLRPAEALAARECGEITMILPTVRTLQALADFRDAASAVAACADRQVSAFLPRIVLRDGEPVALLPGDAGYEAAADQPTPAFDPSRM